MSIIHRSRRSNLRKKHFKALPGWLPEIRIPALKNKFMKHFLLIFLGGGTGSVLRYYLGRALQNYFTASFPYGTLGVNILACLVLGVVAGVAESSTHLSMTSKLLLITGFCGGLSTFSAFSYESVQLMQEEKYVYLALYICLSVLLCMGATFSGLFVGAKL